MCIRDSAKSGQEVLSSMRADIEAKYGRDATHWIDKRKANPAAARSSSLCPQLSPVTKASKTKMTSQRLYEEYLQDQDSLKARTTPGFSPVVACTGREHGSSTEPHPEAYPQVWGDLKPGARYVKPKTYLEGSGSEEEASPRDAVGYGRQEMEVHLAGRRCEAHPHALLPPRDYRTYHREYDGSAHREMPSRSAERYELSQERARDRGIANTTRQPVDHLQMLEAQLRQMQSCAPPLHYVRPGAVPLFEMREAPSVSHRVRSAQRSSGWSANHFTN
eukprot:TRINITY_DN38154_c0_g1_i1.p1 TRINITY_DN38154_c0_g1~~TRINITY_DN38154_c0_g1_i1.p1  ORF type:complete len:276 (-),score=42.38 TRINITY_DN38154_c0_g1_i1:109-936(-)